MVQVPRVGLEHPHHRLCVGTEDGPPQVGVGPRDARHIAQSLTRDRYGVRVGVEESCRQKGGEDLGGM